MVDSFGTATNYGPRSEILPGIFLGDADDAFIIRNKVAGNPGSFGLVAVHEDKDSVTLPAHWVPIMVGDENKDPANYRASREALDAATSLIRHYQKRGIPVMVHCWAGIERSPLTMAHFLVRYKYQPTMNDAYAFIRAKRPQVMERLHWLPSKEPSPSTDSDAEVNPKGSRPPSASVD